MSLIEQLAPRAISKSTDPEGRSQLAETILKIRQEDREQKTQMERNRHLLQKASELMSISQEVQAQKSTELLERQKKVFVKIQNMFGLRDVQASRLETEIDAIASQQKALNAQIESIELELQELLERRAELPHPKELLSAYYEKQALTPLSLEQKKDLLQSELVAELSTEQYLALWRRLNPHFLAHVTRQGFRDHNMMMFHSAGMREFHNGFVASMRDDHMLRSPMVVRELPNRKEETVAEWLKDILALPNESEALQALKARFHDSFLDTPRYADSTSIHFAAQDVAHDYYGAERGNEIFFVFPTDVIASQYDYAFHGGQHDFTRPQSELKWNDVFVWPKNREQGNISLDTGFVFLPKEVLVDPETGSKYASDIQLLNGKEVRVIREDVDRLRSVIAWAKDEPAVSRLSQSLQKHRAEFDQFQVEEVMDAFQMLLPDALKKLGFDLQMTGSVTTALLDKMRYEKNPFAEDTIREIFEDTGALFLSPEQPVTAQTFWERWFSEHPHLRPKHLTFYDGDPATAVYRFLAEHNIGRADTSAQHGKLLGFQEHYVSDMHTDPRASHGANELQNMCQRIITKTFSQKNA